MRELRVLGPPGTGKTTYLSRKIESAAEKFGSENIIVASFTKAAATELNHRNLPIPKEAIGTLHALCYRAMDRPEIAELHCKEWNEEYPKYGMSGKTNNLDEGAADISYDAEGDMFLAQYNLCRATQGDYSALHPKVIEFIKVWENWKLRNNYVDFTDLIYFTIQGKAPAPGNPVVGFFDEAQDFNAMQMTLLRQWAQYMEYIMVSGDDDQTLYSWSGASPDSLMHPEIPKYDETILQQSWRLPRIIQEHSTKYIKQITNRVQKEFRARDSEGELKAMAKSTYLRPEWIVDEAMKYVQNGKTVMFLASCGYMLNPLKAVLRKTGTPFHNPYRKTRGDWNPLGTFGGYGVRVTTRDRLLAFMRDGDELDGMNLWPIHDLHLWTDIVKSRGILKPKAKELIVDATEGIDKYNPATLPSFYREIFDPVGLERALKRDIRWFHENCLASKRSVLDFPIAVYRKHGPEALTEKPKIIISTIHGVKGGESDVVFLWPDISVAAHKEAETQSGKEAMIRMFYVGMTRARESLIICDPSSDMRAKLI